jgi:hypothetical protein
MEPKLGYLPFHQIIFTSTEVILFVFQSTNSKGLIERELLGGYECCVCVVIGGDDQLGQFVSSSSNRALLLQIGAYIKRLAKTELRVAVWSDGQVPHYQRCSCFGARCTFLVNLPHCSYGDGEKQNV